jgi:hypothetical protein
VIANEEYSFLPAFGPQLVGLKIGDAKDVSVAFDGQSPIEELRGKTAVFAATVKKIRARAKAGAGRGAVQAARREGRGGPARDLPQHAAGRGRPAGAWPAAATS